MHFTSFARSAVAACVAVAVGLSLFSPAARGEEPARQFLEALREQGLFDLANEYLQRMEKSPAAPPEFRDTILFEQGLTLMAVSRSETDFARRQQRLDEAQQKFREFLTAQKNHDFAPKAKSQLANVLVERARVKIAEDARAKDPTAKPAILKAGRAFFEQALKEFEASQADIAKKLESLPKQLDPQRDAKRIEYRDGLRKDYIEVQMVQAVILYEMSETAVNRQDKNAVLKRAAEKYGEIYEKYRRRLAGLYALLQQGKCYQEMGGKDNIKEALTFYQELMEQPEEPHPFRVIRTKTLVQSLQCRLSDDLDDEDRAIDKDGQKASEWILKMRPNENRDSDWLQLHYELARAHKMKMAGLDPAHKDFKTSKTIATNLVDQGIKFSDDPLKTSFLELKTELGGRIDTPDEKPDPKNFAEAYVAGVGGWKAITDAQKQIILLEGKLEKTKDKQARAEADKILKEARDSMVEARGDAIDYFRKALLYVEPDTSLDELNFARFYLCSLHWTQKDYPEAAVYGEFLGTHFAGHKTAKYCAIYARASYQNMYNEAKLAEEAKEVELADRQAKAAPDDADAQAALNALKNELARIEQSVDFASNGVVRVSKVMLEKWKDEPEAEETLLVLIKFMVLQKNVAEARKYLALVPVESKNRGDAEITTGQAMWSTYLAEMKPARELERENNALERDIKSWQGEDAEQPPEGASIEAWQAKIAENQQKIDALTDQLEPLKQESQTTLTNGIDRMRKAEVDKTLAAAVATLCRIYVEADQAQDAIKLMEDPDIGALTLVEKNHPAVQREGVPAEVYTTALLAYFAALPDAANTQELFAKAEKAMDGLNGTVGKDEEGQQKLIGIYVTLAQDVEEMVKRAPSAKRKTLTKVFATFLERVTQTSDDAPVLSWAADNFYKLGVADDPGQGDPPAEVKEFYGKAAEQYQKLLAKAGTDESISDNMVVFLRNQLATVYRRQGKYVLAMDQFEEILKDPKRNSMLDLQIAAAETYMEWAASEVGIDRLYLRAINGGRRSGPRKNNIWGWVMIGKRLAQQIEKDPSSKDKFYDTMHLAKVQQAQCYYLYGMTLEGDQRTKYLKYAKQDVRLASQSFPDLGGDAKRREYDEVLKEVQTALKEAVLGLKAFASSDDNLASAADGEDGSSGSDDGGGGE